MKYKHLCDEVERVAGQHIHSYGDFNTLADKIRKRTCVHLSPTTLKRLWGYINEDVQPRTATLDTLAQFVGYRDYKAFCTTGSQAESNPIFSRYITDKHLVPGQMLCLMWHPDRRIVARHEGEGNFTIVEAEHTKLSVGDTFSCHLIIEHEPLYINNVVHAGVAATRYVAGRDGGVLFEIM